jgi:hypothetical protein
MLPQYPLATFGGFDSHRQFLPFGWIFLGGGEDQVSYELAFGKVLEKAREADPTWDCACFIQDDCKATRAAIGWVLKAFVVVGLCVKLNIACPTGVHCTHLCDPLAHLFQGGVRLEQAGAAVPMAHREQLAGQPEKEGQAGSDSRYDYVRHACSHAHKLWCGVHS